MMILFLNKLTSNSFPIKSVHMPFPSVSILEHALPAQVPEPWSVPTRAPAGPLLSFLYVWRAFRSPGVFSGGAVKTISGRLQDVTPNRIIQNFAIFRSEIISWNLNRTLKFGLLKSVQKYRGNRLTVRHKKCWFENLFWSRLSIEIKLFFRLSVLNKPCPL